MSYSLSVRTTSNFYNNYYIAFCGHKVNFVVVDKQRKIMWRHHSMFLTHFVFRWQICTFNRKSVSLCFVLSRMLLMSIYTRKHCASSFIHTGLSVSCSLNVPPRSGEGDPVHSGREALLRVRTDRH